MLEYKADYQGNHEELNTTGKPIVLLWFWPLALKFDLKDCSRYFNIDGCILTDDRSLYSKSKGVIFFHNEIDRKLKNMPQIPRPIFQRWIWFNMKPPTNTLRVPGLDNLFNMTLNYRTDASIPVINSLFIKPSWMKDDFTLPKKDKLVCWFVHDEAPSNGRVGDGYYKELSKYVTIHRRTIGGQMLSYENYYSAISNCKFYLSFEDTINRDYITESHGPLCMGTVPVVLGPPRPNYEQFYPSNAFIHVNDFPDAKSLADHLHFLDKNDEAYMKYFEWRKHYTAIPYLLPVIHEFIKPICLACDYISRNNEYYVIQGLNEWYFS
ncbi:4-galactosyl-N-acetylglucosaminide 3-alpha-L-fucosyltransferase 9-like [Antennarius striatus]|uniref:4-galactosyl-N-acetylglucosaminide 3-alpha-L-fucosyltransferase 9-like n=1 Tax=Antennarius striatus TaxID=241820 RepID=UPI0035B043A6